MICLNCNVVINESDLFCNRCGTKVGKNVGKNDILNSDDLIKDVFINPFDEAVENNLKVTYGFNVANVDRRKDSRHCRRTTERGDWVYLWGFKDSTDLFIAKMKQDGSAKQTIVKLDKKNYQMNIYLNVVGEHLYYIELVEHEEEYYSAIVRINVNGTGKKVILRSKDLRETLTDLLIINSKLYFIAESKAKIFKANTDGTDVKCVFSTQDYFHSLPEPLVFTLIGANTNELAVNIEDGIGSDRVLIIDVNSQSASKLSEFYHFTKEEKIQRHAQFGNNVLYIDMQKEIVFINCNDSILGVNKSGDIVSEWLLKNNKNEKITGYYIDGEICLFVKWAYIGGVETCKLYKVLSNGVPIVLVDDYVSQVDIKVVGEFAYYYNERAKLSRIKLDGTLGEVLCD